MSKAFTRESDDAPAPPSRPALVSPLPPGAKNYLTAEGARRLQAELEQLETSALPPTATLKDDSTTLHATQQLRQRRQYLQQSLATAVIVAPPTQPWEQVRFGATVATRNQTGEPTTYRIVGVDETDADRNWVSWLSPIACALLNARLGQTVRFKLPTGEAALEILQITYE
jgi:transcription elongation factor GreB